MADGDNLGSSLLQAPIGLAKASTGGLPGGTPMPMMTPMPEHGIQSELYQRYRLLI